MKIAVLTSSRADFGIYLCLLKRIEQDAECSLDIIAFGTHLSKFHGYTIDNIKQAGFKNIHTITSLLTNDDEASIATAFGLTALKFADFWNSHTYDWVLCLGDRFEMAAAVQAGIPYGVKFAHLHGGETTLGAIDNIYRHQMTLASQMHFAATEVFAEKITQLTGTTNNIYTVGSLSIDELDGLPILSEQDFKRNYKIKEEFALLTFHPETVSPEQNVDFASETKLALTALAQKMLLVITMPNADTFGSVFRQMLLDLQAGTSQNILLIENFGKLNYFAAMRYCKLMIGNTSSGIIEAATFNKYVVNVGDRQKGRAQSGNIINVPFNADKIIEAATCALQLGPYLGDNIYSKPGTAEQILYHLKADNYEEL
ncbi:UDP-N-acetylglucosamine 2-epimerase (hydrolyzing) [Mucilaginibacter rigui]|uniref:UDP-N-acetylglucosamine 2-epimerase (Hydrolyzing) n=1 Tax=Mucilaginibacter rigui TaxID=534635 RepID=A0ABR7X6L4_9SPHI|nr:UDP-N-acetylglucosamine 2-epimerase [Mucilaginibacter rigui]MBD1386226.1 UDP-N-acetylglucosamine 2-epimerase (hydrolyzing) [Mucilaginibacter rigui]